MKVIRIFSILFLISIIVSSSFAQADLIRRDDFRDRKSWWYYGSRCTDFPRFENGVLHLYQELAYNYRECGTDLGASGAHHNIFDYYTAIMRVKTLTQMRPGSIGWGFWDFEPPWPGDVSYSDICWFMKQYDPFNPLQTW